MKKYKNFIKILFVVSLFIGGAYARSAAETPPGAKWAKTFGGTDNDYAQSIQKTIDGGYIIAGHTKSYSVGFYDFWLIKTDSGGNEEWNKTFGGSNNDYAYSAQQTTDGGYIVAGWTASYGAGNSDFWLIKTDSGGNEEWAKTFGGSYNDYAYSVQQTTDGGYIVAGETASYGAGISDAWIIKVNSQGDELWNKTFGKTNFDTAYSIQQTTDGGYIIAGSTKSYGNGLYHDAWLVKTDSQGNELWSRTFGGSNEDYTESVQQTTDGGYILAGYTLSYGTGLYDAWLIKTDSQGNELWSRTFGGSDYDWDYARSVKQTTDGGYILAGETDSYGAGSYDFWLIKTDSEGNELWSRTFGGSSADYAKSVQQTTDGGYIVVGDTASYGAGKYDVWLLEVVYPLAHFLYIPQIIVFGKPVLFDASGSEAYPGGSIVSYGWDFGDGNSVITTAITNHTYREGGDYTITLTITDNSGNINSFSQTIRVEEAEWIKTFGSSSRETIYSVQQTTDDGYILAGETESYGAGWFDVWLIKTDSQGNEQWRKTFGGTGDDTAYSVQQTTDGGYIVAGETDSYGAGGFDVWLIKTDSQGNEQWRKTFGGTEDDYAYLAEQTTDGGYIVAGETASYGAGGFDFYVLKTDTESNELWSRTFGGSSNDGGTSVQQTQDGGYIVTGWTGSYDGGRDDALLIKIASEAITHTLNFASGYTLWALPLYLPEELTSKELIAGIPYARKIFTWDNNLNKWIYTIKVGTEITGDDFQIEASRGYFILAEQDTSYTFAGSLINEPIIPELTYGFNVTRVYDPQNSYTSYKFLQENSRVQLILSLGTNNGEWICAEKGFFREIIGANFTLEPNKSYIILYEQEPVGEFKFPVSFSETKTPKQGITASNI